MDQVTTTIPASSTFVKVSTLIALVAVGLIALAILLVEQRTAISEQSLSNQANSIAPAADQTDLNAEYRSKVKAIVARYNAGKSGDLATLARELRTELLNLNVPSDARNVHLAAVVSLSNISEGGFDSAFATVADQAMIELGRY